MSGLVGVWGGSRHAPRRPDPRDGAPGRAYSIRLSEPDGRPVGGAEVWLQGRSSDGRVVQAQLAPAGDSGLYRGSLPAAGSTSPLSVRVVLPSMRFEVPVADVGGQ